MFRKISIVGFVIIAAYLMNFAYQQIEQSQYKNELTLRLGELEKLPHKQRSADIYLEMADLYLSLEYSQDKTIKAYIQASDAGNSQASYTLAVLSGNGKKVGTQLPTYEKLFEKAASEGSLSAAFVIKAQHILNTTNMPVGYEDAYKKLSKAANQGNTEAAFALCSHGKEAISKIFVTGNMEYCKEALKKNHPPAQYLMGRLYEQNPAEFHPETWGHIGLEKNISKAQELYQLAANQLYRPAIERLNLLRTKKVLSIIKAKDKYAYLPDICIECFD